jgi:two-component system invasion response regulator UvrY
MTTLRIVIVEDRDVVRIGLQTTIREMPGCDIVGAYATVVELNRCLQHDGPQVLILDDTLPGIDTESFVRRLKHEYPALKVIMFGSDLTAAKIYGLIDANADGFVFKGEQLSSVMSQAIDFAKNGELFISPQLARAVLSYNKSNKPIELSERLKEVLALIALGFEVKQIAQTLGVSDKAVYNARDRLKELLHANSAADILNRAIKLKLIEPKESQDS